MTESALIVFDAKQALEQAMAYSNIVRDMREKKILKPGIDYGPIPGSDKDALKKPGAEKLCTTFGLAPSFDTVSQIEQWDADKPMFNYRICCRLVHIASGKTIAAGIGSCNSMESKYRYRWLWENQLKDFGLKSDGMVTRTTKNGKKQYRVANDDIFSQVNTIDKMAQKRALVAAVLIATNASDQFTQDLDDIPRYDDAIEGEIIEEQDIVPEIAQNWFDANGDKFLKTIEGQFDLDQAAAELLVGQPLRNFTTGKDAGQAIKLAFEAQNSKPATPKHNSDNLWTPSLTDYLAKFELTPELALKKLKVDRWEWFKDLSAAGEAIREAAFKNAWPMIATTATYKDAGGKKVIVFNTPIQITWFKGRHELMKAAGETCEADWSAVAKWEFGDHPLPEHLRITPKINGEYLEAHQIESADEFPWPTSTGAK